MRVEALPASGVGAGWSGGVPSVVSDEHGNFVLSVPLWAGRILRVYPLDESRYYPALNGLFYQTEGNRGEIVTLGKDSKATLQLRLGPKAGALKAKVTDASTGAPFSL